jgi:hypothetical protein
VNQFSKIPAAIISSRFDFRLDNGMNRWPEVRLGQCDRQTSDAESGERRLHVKSKQSQRPDKGDRSK